MPLKISVSAPGGASLTLEDWLLENSKPGAHNWIIAILIPIFAIGMALLAWMPHKVSARLRKA